MQLTAVQVRILGCLIEKERTTPDNYPLTMNALLAACNQTTNRYPVVTFNESTVANALENLRAAKLLRVDYSRSNRADKYRQVLDETLELDDEELAVLSVVMLRGPQTAAELRVRTERLHPFENQEALDATLARLAERADPLVVRLKPAAGQKEARWAHLLGGEAPVEMAAVETQPRSTRGTRLEELEERLTALRHEVEQLRAAHDSLAEKLRDLTE